MSQPDTVFLLLNEDEGGSTGEVSQLIYLIQLLYPCVPVYSGGKDSCYSMMKCVAAGHQIVALANLQPAAKVGKPLLASYPTLTLKRGRA